MVAYLQKSEGSEGFHQIVDFLTASHIRYALTESPTIHVSLIEQFWQTATASTLENGDMEITATIDGKVKVVSEASIRRHLKLEDSDGISDLPTTEIFEQLALMGSKKTAWEQFSSNIATAIICLATNRTFNFSKLIFEAMGEGSTIPVESHHTPTSAPSTLQPPTSSPSMPTTHVAEEATPMPHDSPLLMVYLLRSDEGSLTLNELKVKKLEHNIKSIKASRKVRLVISDDEDDLEDPSKQGRKIAQIDEDEGITLTGVYDYQEGFTGPSISITTVEPVTTAGEGVSTARTILEEVSTAEPDMDVTLAEALVDLLKSGKKSHQSQKQEKDQIQSDEELALRLHAEEQAKFERLQKERVTQEEANRAAIYEEMDNIQAMIEADEQLATRVQAEEQELYSIKEKSRLLVEMIAERKRFFAAQSAAEQRSKPPTKTQMRNRMCTCLKNMGGYKYNQLKGKSYKEIQKLFDKTYKQKTLAKKRAGEKPSEWSSKRQKMEDNAKKEELRAYLDIILGDDVALSVESLATKHQIVDWRTHVLSEDKMY
ncbi:hypothetical protein Tco_0761643 [Tanacetum coccineum]